MMGTVWPVLSIAEAEALLTAPDAFFAMDAAVISGHPTRIWRHAPATLKDLLLRARGFGARECLVFGADRVSFESFARAALAVAAELVATGVRPGDRVALAMRNLPEWPAIFFGAVLAGAVVVPVNAWWSGAEIAAVLADCGAKVLFADSERWLRLQDRVGETQVYVCRFAGAVPARIRPLEAVLGAVADWPNLPPRRARADAPDIALDPDGDAAIFYTSGTTGAARGVVCSHRNLLSSILAMGFSLARDIVRATGKVPPVNFLETPQRGVLLTIPLFHVTGCCAVLGPSLYIGAKLVMMRKWDAGAALRLIAAERLMQVWGVPAVAWDLVRHPARTAYDTSSLRLISYGGAPFSADLAARIHAAFPHAYAACGWGMTETAAICTSHSGRDYLLHAGASGLPAPVCDLRVMDPETGSALPPGAVGEVWARGPNVARGYWRRPEETQQVFRDGWVRTGDLASLDAEGFCTIVDRVKDVLIRGGENVSCREIEDTLCAHPMVAEAAVVPLPHAVLGEEPAAMVRLKSGGAVGEAELKHFVADRLAAFKVPVRILFCTDALPRNAGGKLARRELHRLFLQMACVSVS